MIYRFINLLASFFSRKPDKTINDKYLLRWHLIPRNKYFNIYLHKFIGDDDRVYHDHPFHSLSILLKGEYKEFILKSIQRNNVFHLCHRKHHKPVKLIFRSALRMHRLEVIDGPVWTIFITGPRFREWGFNVNGKWIAWHKYERGGCE